MSLTMEQSAKLTRMILADVPLSSLVRLTDYSLAELVNEIIPAVCAGTGHVYSVHIK